MACSLNNDKVVPAIVSLVAFVLSLAGWWLAWICGLIAMIFCVVMVCADLPRPFSLVTAILAAIAAIGEFLVAIRLVDASVICSGDNCFASKLGLTIVAVITLILWAVVAFMSWRDYR